MTNKKPLKIMIILGTRPEGIKLAPVIHAVHERAKSCDLQLRVCVTGQHREMLDQVMQLFGITPDIDLDLMRPGQTPSQVAARVLLALEPVMLEERPDWILVQGDTTTVMASAIAAHHLHVKVGHVEAGLRSGDRENPFPEEMNRVVAGHISDLHFAPTPRARQNLLREGIADERIYVTGNTVVDALRQIAEQPTPAEIAALIENDKRMILVTAHRRENFGAPLANVCSAIQQLARQRTDIQFIYPVHLNPNVHAPVHEILDDVPNVTLIPPQDYLSLVHLMKASFLILTDSGGIQEEAPSFGRPVLVLRDVTERPEAVEAGVARLVGTDPERILCEMTHLLDDPQHYRAMAREVNPYGDGFASQRIVEALLAFPN